jgi:MSHA biogenesis protein MshJ
MIAMLRQRLEHLADRIDQRSLRERGLIFLSVLVSLFMLASHGVLTPLSEHNRQQERVLRDKLDQIEKLEQQIQQTLAATRIDPDAEYQRRLDVLREQLAQRAPTLANASRALVPPTEMVRLVENMLARNRNLQVIRVENLPAEPLDAPTNQESSTPAPPISRIFRHGMHVEVRGRYPEIVAYLNELEALPWKMFWGPLAINAEDFPYSRMSVVIYTLSMRPGWLGT